MLLHLGVKSIFDVSNGGAALDAIRSSAPNIMILDWNISGLDAREIVRLVRRTNGFPDANLPIIVISNSGKYSIVNEAIALGVNYFLVRPLSPKLLEQHFLGIVVKSRERALADNMFKPVPIAAD